MHDENLPALGAYPKFDSQSAVIAPWKSRPVSPWWHIFGGTSTFIDPFQTKCSNFNTCFLRITVAQIIQVHLQSYAYAVFDAKNLVSFEQDFVLSTPKHDGLPTRSSQDGIIAVNNVDWCN